MGTKENFLAWLKQLDFAKQSFWMWVAGIYLLLLLISAILSIAFIGTEWNWGLALFLALVLYTIASFLGNEVGPSEVGVRLLFGDPINQVGSGLTFVPVGLVTLERFPNETQQAELPEEPGKIYRGTDIDKDGKNVPVGMYPPIRIVFGAPDKPTTDPYDQRMVAEVTPVIRYRIVNAILFIQTIKNWANARLQIEDTVVAVLNEELSKVTPAKALTMLSGPNGLYKKLENTIDALVKSWGIDLVSISLKPFGYSHSLNEAVLEVPKAQRKKEADIIIAEGDKGVKTLAGEGLGAAEKAVLDGRTDGLKRMASELGVNGAAVLAAETARGITNNPGQKTIIAGSGGFKDIAMAGTILGETLNQQKGV